MLWATISLRQRRKVGQTINSFVKKEETVITGLFREVVLMVTPQWTCLFRRCNHNMVSSVAFVCLIRH